MPKPKPKEKGPLVALVYDVRATAPTEIVSYLHCGECMKQVAQQAEAEGSASPREWARLEVGRTPGGLQVRCVRHDLNVALVAAWPGEAVLGVLRRVLKIVDREGIGADEDESGPLVAEIRAILREAGGGVGGATTPRGGERRG